MKKNTVYSPAPPDLQSALLEAREVPDFLPPPDQLLAVEDTRKVTLALSTRSLDFFKRMAQKSNVSYQQMIRRVLDLYAERYGR